MYVKNKLLSPFLLHKNFSLQTFFIHRRRRRRKMSVSKSSVETLGRNANGDQADPFREIITDKQTLHFATKQEPGSFCFYIYCSFNKKMIFSSIQKAFNHSRFHGFLHILSLGICYWSYHGLYYILFNARRSSKIRQDCKFFHAYSLYPHFCR